MKSSIFKTASYQYQSRRRTTKNNLEQDNHCGSDFSEIIDHHSKNHDADSTQSRILLSPSYRNSGKAAVHDDDCMRTQQNDENKNNINDFSIAKNNKNNNKLIVDEVIYLMSDADDDHHDDEDKPSIKQQRSSSSSFRNKSTTVHDDDSISRLHNNNNKNNNKNSNIDSIDNKNKNKRIEIITDEIIEILSNGECGLVNNNEDDDDEDILGIWDENDKSSCTRMVISYKPQQDNNHGQQLLHDKAHIHELSETIKTAVTTTITTINTPSISLSNKTTYNNENINNDVHHDSQPRINDESSSDVGTKTVITTINTPFISLSNKTTNIINENINEIVHHEEPCIHDEFTSCVGIKTAIESSLLTVVGVPYVEDPPPPSFDKYGLVTGAIFGIVFGTILGVLLVGGTAYTQASDKSKKTEVIPLVEPTTSTLGICNSKTASSSKAEIAGFSLLKDRNISNGDDQTIKANNHKVDGMTSKSFNKDCTLLLTKSSKKTPKQSLKSSASSMTTKAACKIIKVIAPAGELGIVIECPRTESFPVIRTVSDHSPLKDQLYSNDLIISISSKSTSSMTLVMIVDNLRDNSTKKRRSIVVQRCIINKDYRTVIAPPGKLGIRIDKKLNGKPIVKRVNKKSPLYNKLLVNDKIIAIDNQRYDIMRTTDSILKYLISNIHRERIFQVCTPVNRTRKVVAPVGILGINIDQHGNIVSINNTSPLIDQLIVGDIILQIDNLDVETMTHESFIEYIQKNVDKERTLIVTQPTMMEYAMKTPLGKFGIGVIDKKPENSEQHPIIQRTNDDNTLSNQLLVKDQVICIDNQTKDHMASSMVPNYKKDNKKNNKLYIKIHRNIDGSTSLSASTTITTTINNNTPAVVVDDEAVPSGVTTTASVTTGAETTKTDETKNTTINADATDAAVSPTVIDVVVEAVKGAATTNSTAIEEMDHTRNVSAIAASTGLATAAVVGVVVYTTKKDNDGVREEVGGKDEPDTPVESNTQESSTTTAEVEVETELDAMTTYSPKVDSISTVVAAGDSVVSIEAVITASSSLSSLNDEDELDIQPVVTEHNQTEHNLSQYCQNKKNKRVVALLEDCDDDYINRMVENSDQNAHASKRQKNDLNSNEKCVVRNLRLRSMISLENSKCNNNITKEDHDDMQHNSKMKKTKKAKYQEAIAKKRLLQEELTYKKQLVHFEQLYYNGMQYLKRYKYYSASIELSNAGNIMKILLLNFIQQKRYKNKNENSVMLTINDSNKNLSIHKNSLENKGYNDLLVMVEKYAKCYYYKAMCHYKDNKYLQAIMDFNKIIVIDTNIVVPTPQSSNQIECQNNNNVLLPNDVLVMIPKLIQADALCQRAKANLHIKLSLWKQNNYDDDNVDDDDTDDDSFDNNIISSDMIFQQLLRHPNESASIMKDVKAAASFKNKDAILWYNQLQSQQRNKLNVIR